MTPYPSIRAFISYLARYKGSFWLTAGMFALADIAIAVTPWLIGRLTASLTGRGDDIAFWTGAVIAGSVIHAALWHSAEFIYLRKLVARAHRFDDIVFSAVMRHEYSFFTDKFTGKVSSYANSLGRNFRELLDNSLYQYVNLFIALPIIIATMFSVNAYTGYLFLVSLALMFIVGRKLARISAAAERKESDERSTMDGFVVDAVANFVSIKAFGSEWREARRLAGKRHRLIRAAEDSYLKAVLFWGSMSVFVRSIIWPAAFILNVYLFTQDRVDIAQMTTFLAAIVVFSNYIWEVIWNISQLNIKLAGIEEAYHYLFGDRNIFKEDTADGRRRQTDADFSRTLELHGLSFAYPDKPEVPVLNDVNLTIRKGETIGIVGPSGGGKSTLLKLLLGYYPLEAGQLLLDGRPIDNRTLTDLSSYVPQDTAVFHRPIGENIAYARPDARQEDIITAARHAQAHGFITALDAGYDTLVGERGVKLSGGQRQRIAIARAILKDAPLLMLDEATSALDSESEKLIQKALRDLLKGRTALVIAHRLSTIQHLDRIIVFDGGRIVEEGTHASLLEQDGLYARLWSHQTDGFIQD